MSRGLDPNRESIASSTVEDYLKVIHEICQRSKAGIALNGQIADELQLVPGSVTVMVQRLAKMGLVAYEAHRGCQLTAAGLDIAERVIRRHCTLERFLAHVLGLDAERVHDEAENLEHAASDALITEIQRYLCCPRRAA
ncbi:MAG: metal-dependent transcriptional regulator [Pirellulales bacterium]